MAEVHMERTCFGERTREYHTDCRLSNIGSCRLWDHFDVSTYEVELGSLAVTIAHQLFQVIGIDKVEIKKFSIEIRIGVCFDWEEVEPMVVEIIRRTIEKYVDESLQEVLEEAEQILKQNPAESE